MTDEGGAEDSSLLLRTDPEIAAAYARSTIEPGDLVISIGPSFGKVMVVPPGLAGANLTQGTARIAVNRPADARFVFWALRSTGSFQHWESSVGGATFRALNLGPLAVTPIPMPDPHTQSAIAEHLDRETARIDALIVTKERVLGLLAAKRRALITRAVTRGLDHNVPVRDSRIPWLGTIPAHWTPHRLKFLSPHITVGIVVTPAKYYEAFGVPCLRSLNVREGGLSESDLVFISEDSHRLHSKSIVRVGDLVAVRSGQPGTTAVVDQRFNGANCIDLIIIRRSDRLDSEYLAHFLNSQPAKMQFLSGSGGAIQQHFNIETAADLVVPLPPLAEQREIVAWVARETGKLDELRVATERTVALLKERRSALIAAAVTGQVDVGCVG